MIRLYNYPLSPCGEKVRFALLEKRLVFDETEIDLTVKQNLQPDFLAINPAGLVPVLRNGKDIVVESTVILEYLEDAFPEVPLRPASPADRAEMRIWTRQVDAILHPAWPSLAWPVLIRPRWLTKSPAEIEALIGAMPDAEKRARQRSMLAHGTDAPEYLASLDVLSHTLDRMESRLEKADWLAGKALSLADLAVLPYVFVADLFGLGKRMFGNRPACAGWYRRIGALPAFGGDLHNLYPSDRLAEVAAVARGLITA